MHEDLKSKTKHRHWVRKKMGHEYKVSEVNAKDNEDGKRC